MILHCSKCQGEAAECDACDGSGSQRCEARSCSEQAIGFDEDGRALCEDCLAEWACNYGEDEETADGWMSDGSWKQGG